MVQFFASQCKSRNEVHLTLLVCTNGAQLHVKC